MADTITQLVGFSTDIIVIPAPGDSIAVTWAPLPLTFDAPGRIRMTPEQDTTGFFIETMVKGFDPDTGIAQQFVDNVAPTVEDTAASYDKWRGVYTRSDTLHSRIGLSTTQADLAVGSIVFTTQSDKVFQKHGKALLYPRKAADKHGIILIDAYAGTALTTRIVSSADIFGVSTIEVRTITLQAAGTGHARGDVVPLTGGTGTQATITVTDIDDATGAITAFELTTPGSYSVFPSSPAAQGTSSGSGISATFNVVSSIRYSDWIIELIDIPAFTDPSIGPFKHAFLGGL